jgi:hypothetical protein
VPSSFFLSFFFFFFKTVPTVLLDSFSTTFIVYKNYYN